MNSDSPPKATFRSQSRIFLVWLLAVFCLKWQTMTDPPVWDAAVGLFPAAGALADSGFDLKWLLQQPTGFDGGPNTHTESIVTWMTAGMLWIFGKDPSSLPVLHVIHFCIAAWTLTVLQCLVTEVLGRSTAVLLCGTVLLCPLFHVQAGTMYLEMPQALCVVSAVAAYSRGQLGRSVVWSTLAVMVKQSGIVLSGALALATVLRRSSVPLRLGLSSLFAILGLAAAFLPLLGTPVLDAFAVETSDSGLWEYVSVTQTAYIVGIPDIVALCLMFGFGGIVRYREVWRSLTDVPTTNIQAESFPADQRGDAELINVGPNEFILAPVSSALGVSWLLLGMFGVFFFFASYYSGLQILLLPRYFVAILPLVLFGLTYWLSRLVSRRIVMSILSLVMLLFLVNRNGNLYPPEPGSNLSYHERAEAYRLQVAAQREASQTVSELPDSAIIFYGLPEHFFMTQPWMGYANRRHPGGRCIAMEAERPKSANKQDLPDEFFLIFDDRWYWGGAEMQAILQRARKDPTRQVTRHRRCQRGQFVIDVIHVGPSQKPAEPVSAEVTPSLRS